MHKCMYLYKIRIYPPCLTHLISFTNKKNGENKKYFSLKNVAIFFPVPTHPNPMAPTAFTSAAVVRGVTRGVCERPERDEAAGDFALGGVAWQSGPTKPCDIPCVTG